MSMDIEEQYDKIYRYCYFKLHHAQMAEDVTQETFLRYLECDSYKDIGRPLAFLYTIAGNLCVDEFRKKRNEELPEEMAGENEESRVVDNLSLRMALAELSEREKDLIILRFVNEVPVADLAKLYGISRFSLYRETNQILKKLERRISDGTERKTDIETGIEANLSG